MKSSRLDSTKFGSHKLKILFFYKLWVYIVGVFSLMANCTISQKPGGEVRVCCIV